MLTEYMVTLNFGESTSTTIVTCNSKEEAFGIAFMRKAVNKSKISLPIESFEVKRMGEIEHIRCGSNVPQDLLFLQEHDLSQEVRDFLSAREKIQAIKQLRMETGLGLKEAKDVCDKYIDKFQKYLPLY